MPLSLSLKITCYWERDKSTKVVLQNPECIVIDNFELFEERETLI